MEVRIETCANKYVVGRFMRMSIADNKTFELWRDFMTSKSALKNTISTVHYSVQVYDEVFDFENFNPEVEFTKWAAIELEGEEVLPDGFEGLNIEEGLYAVFLHKGPASEFAKTFGFIFNEWLPKSNYLLDHRPHFEVLGEKYKNNHPSSEEEVWVPIKNRLN